MVEKQGIGRNDASRPSSAAELVPEGQRKTVQKGSYGARLIMTGPVRSARTETGRDSGGGGGGGIGGGWGGGRGWMSEAGGDTRRCLVLAVFGKPCVDGQGDSGAGEKGLGGGRGMGKGNTYYDSTSRRMEGSG